MPSSASYAKPWVTLGSLIDRRLIIPLADGTYKPTEQGIETADAIRRLDRGEPIRRPNIAERGINRNFNKYYVDGGDDIGNHMSGVVSARVPDDFDKRVEHAFQAFADTLEASFKEESTDVQQKA